MKILMQNMNAPIREYKHIRANINVNRKQNFPHNAIHTAIWRLPIGITENLIDHISIINDCIVYNRYSIYDYLDNDKFQEFYS